MSNLALCMKTDLFLGMICRMIASGPVLIITDLAVGCCPANYCQGVVTDRTGQELHSVIM